MNDKKCVIFNYIPHKTPKNVTFGKWFKHYHKEISNMYNIMNEVVDARYPNSRIEWGSQEHFIAFAEMLYLNSSKYMA